MWCSARSRYTHAHAHTHTHTRGVLQEVSQRYQRGEFVESAATLMATGADLGLKGLTNLKGLLKTAVSQIDGYAGPALANDGCVAFFSQGWRPLG